MTTETAITITTTADDGTETTETVAGVDITNATAAEIAALLGITPPPTTERGDLLTAINALATVDPDAAATIDYRSGNSHSDWTKLTAEAWARYDARRA